MAELEIRYKYSSTDKNWTLHKTCSTREELVKAFKYLAHDSGVASVKFTLNGEEYESIKPHHDTLDDFLAENLKAISSCFMRITGDEAKKAICEWFIAKYGFTPQEDTIKFLSSNSKLIAVEIPFKIDDVPKSKTTQSVEV